VRRYQDDFDGGMESNVLADLLCRPAPAEEVEISVVLSRTHDVGYMTRVDFERATVVSNHAFGHLLAVRHRTGAPGGAIGRRWARLSVDRPRNFAWGFEQQWIEFAARVRGGPEVLSSLADAVRTVDVVHECYGRRERLDLSWETSLCAGPAAGPP
jgi:hypothetical protein